MIKDVLKALREEKGLKKSETASALGMPYTTYNNYETGTRDPGSDTLILLSKHYGVTIDYLLGRTSDKKAAVPIDNGFGKDNDEFKNMQDVLSYLKAEMVRDGLIKEGDPLPLEVIKMLYKIASPAIKLLMDKSDTDEAI